MSLADLRKWDARYRGGSYSERRHPSALLEQCIADLPRGTALDVACGAGRNALFLAASGFEVDAVDISAEGLARLRADADSQQLTVRTLEADLEHGFASSLDLRDCYDLVLMVRYVNLPLLEPLTDRLSDGGFLIVEEHLRTDRDVVGPRNETYRLAPNALLNAAEPLRIHYYREGIVTDPDGREAALAQLVASRNGQDIVGAA